MERVMTSLIFPTANPTFTVSLANELIKYDQIIQIRDAMT